MPLHPQDARLVQQTIDKVRSMGVKVDGRFPNKSGLSAQPWELCKIGTAVAGTGLYSATMYRGYAADFSVTANFNPATLTGFVAVTDAEGAEVTCIVANLAEAGHAANTNLLASGQWVKGEVLGYTEDNELVIVTDAQPPGVIFAVMLSQTSGSAGTGTSDASWVYTVAGLSGVQLATGKSPLWRPIRGPASAATEGQGYFNTSGVFVLTIAYETSTAGVVNVITDAEWVEPDIVFHTKDVISASAAGADISVGFSPCPTP